MKLTDGLSFLDKQLKLNTREDAEEHARLIEATPCLMFLELRGNTLGIEAGQRIAEALEKHPELKYAQWSDLFTGRLKTEIPIIVRGMCSAVMRSGACLTELDLSDNAFGPIGADSIKEFLLSPSAVNLQVLRLNNCGMGSGGVTIANCLLEAHRKAAVAGKKFALKTFVAGRNRLEDPGAKALAKAFKAIGTLEEITVHQNGIRVAGIMALAEALAHNRNLRVVNFNDNTCTRKGALAISFSLGDLKQLELLDLGDCLCRENGTLAIISVLVANPFPKLLKVNVSGNELPASVISSVLNAWQNVRKHTKLIATNNGYGSQFSDLLDDIEERGLAGCVELGAISDDEGSAEEEECDEDEEEYDEDEAEKMSGEDSDEASQLANELAGITVKQQQLQQPVAAAAAAGPFELSFLGQQQRWESTADAEPVAAALEAHPEVTSFVLRGNTLGVAAGERIAKALEKCPNLRDCNWSDLFTGRLRSEIPIIVTRLCDALIRAGVRLRLLDLSDNAFGPVGAESIKAFLESDSAFTLEELHLNNCGLGAGAVIIAKSLLTLHRRARATGRTLQLKVIVAGRNRLEIPGALAFAEAIGEIGTLEELTVHQNGIHRPGVIGLAKGVAKNPNMKRLSVADNVGGWEGGVEFAKALTNLRSLETADFSDCLSKNKGCRALVQAAVRLPELKSLNLSGSELTAKTAEEIVKVWSQAKDKATLHISTNNLSAAFDGVRQLAAQLGGRVDCGESDDDCGSLSGSEADEEDEIDDANKEQDEVDEDYYEDTSDGEKYSEGSSEACSEEEEGYDEAAVSMRTTPIPSLLSVSVPPVFMVARSPTAAGLRELARMSPETLKNMLQPLCASRDQAEAARLFLAAASLASADVTLVPVAVTVLDVLTLEVGRYKRRPIPTIVQLMNHVVAHVDGKIKREENLVEPSSIVRSTLESIIGVLQQRGRLAAAATMISHYFPNVGKGVAAPAAQPAITFQPAQQINYVNQNSFRVGK